MLMDNFPPVALARRHPRQSISHRTQDFACFRHGLENPEGAGSRYIASLERPYIFKFDHDGFRSEGFQPIPGHFAPLAVSQKGPGVPNIKSEDILVIERH